MTVTALTDTPLELGEGVRLVDGRLLLVDILAGTLYAHSGSTSAPLEKLLSLDVPLGAVAPVRGRRDTWIAAAGDGIALLTLDQPVQWLARPEQGTDGRTRMNDGVCDPSGRFWAGSMAQDGTSSLGALYRVDADARVERVLDDLVIVNGPAFSPDGTLMYVVDSGRATITRYDLNRDGWPVGATLLVHEASRAVPDGITVDRSGALWVAMWGGWNSGATHQTVSFSRRSRCPPPSQPVSRWWLGERSSQLPGSGSPIRVRWMVSSSRSPSRAWMT